MSSNLSDLWQLVSVDLLIVHITDEKMMHSQQ